MISFEKGLFHTYAQGYGAAFYFKPIYPHIKQVERHTPRNLRDY